MSHVKAEGTNRNRDIPNRKPDILFRALGLPWFVELQQMGVKITNFADAEHGVAGFFGGNPELLNPFSDHQISIAGLKARSVERGYQALKFADHRPDIIGKILAATSSRRAKDIAHQHAEFVRPDWDELKVSTMLRLNHAKVRQHPEVRAGLLALKGVIVELSATDYFWGIGANGTGTNAAGKVWMTLRDGMEQNMDYDGQRQLLDSYLPLPLEYFLSQNSP